MLLKDKNILLAVTGSIAIYKALELIRFYIKAGAKVKVLMTDGAKKFINPITFEAISQNKVLDELNENWDKSQDYNHIDIGKWADIFIIAPCTANTINKLAHGLGDNLLTQAVLACPKTKILAPAANTNMLKNSITQESIKKLESYGFKVINSQTKELVCKDVGDGAMADPEDIFYASARELLKDEYWIDRKVVLSGGGTIEKIDDVRYISNFSSGKMASSLCLSLYLKGADITLVSTRGHENLPKAINILAVQSTSEMYESLVKSINTAKKENVNKLNKAYLFMVAAVSDYLPAFEQNGKMKKDMIGSTWKMDLKQNIDILNSLDKKDLISIGFKAEMDETVANTNAQKMLETKNLDAVCLNILEDKNSFGSDDNNIELILQDKSFEISGDKLSVSLNILDKLKEEF